MRVISRRRLREFWQQYPDAEKPLQAWYKTCEKTDFENFAHLKQFCGTADKVGKFTVFDIGGDKYRLIATVHYTYRKIYIRAVLTHKEYDRNHWKKE